VYENQWALIICINQYPNFTPLKYAVADANSMKVTLMTQYGKDAGTYNLIWDAADAASGMYFVKAETEGFTTTQKLMLVK
jgi:hypothetical protein